MHNLRAQTNKESRAYTLFAALRRLRLLPSAEKMNLKPVHVLTIHVVGSDYREGNSPLETQEVFRPLFHLLLLHMSDENMNASDTTLNIMQIVLVLVGPGVHGPLDNTEHKSEMTLDNFEVGTSTSKNRGAKLEVCLQFVSKLYHEYHHNEGGGECDNQGGGGGNSHLAFQTPDLSVCFQAGVWGYTDWIPTITDLVSLAPCVITSYNANEADDDWGTLEELLDISAVRWLWEPEVNHFRSLDVRQTKGTSASVSTLLAENSFWQCITVAEVV
jgi:hypothetical protein